MIERLITFSEFDIFAYLVVGLIALVVVDLLFGARLVLRASWGFGDGVIIIVSAYVLGHIIAIPSHWLVEEAVAKRYFMAPKTLLLSNDAIKIRCAKGGAESSWSDETIFVHHRPLSCSVLKALVPKLKAIPEDDRNGEDVLENFHVLLDQGFLAARSDPIARDRMQIFLRLYTFARNMTFVAFAAVTILFCQIVWRTIVILRAEFKTSPARNRKVAASDGKGGQVEAEGATAVEASTAVEAQSREARFLSKLWADCARSATLPVSPAPGESMDPNTALILARLTNRISLFVILLVFGVGLFYRHESFLRLYDGEALTALAFPTQAASNQPALHDSGLNKGGK